MMICQGILLIMLMDQINKMEKKTSCNFMIDTYYVQIDWEDNTSTLSTLYCSFLVGSITIPKALDLDMTDLPSVVERIKTLLLFS